MGFFTPRRRRNSAYDVYNRYTDGYSQPQYEGGRTSNYGLSRNSSMMNGAGVAAAAALKIHQDNGGDRQAYFQDQEGVRRAQSLTGGRTQSVRSYVYHPKPSYNAGEQVGRSPTKRYNFMTGRTGEYTGLSKANSLTGRTQSLTGRSQSLTGRNNVNPTRGNKYGGSASSPQQVKTSSTIDEAGPEEEEGVTVTTNTTKVVDSLGRVQSVTTETVKTYPDGSTVSDKSVKNISRSNSRASSLNSYSYGPRGNRNNSLREGASASGPSYNLSKIDELHDFDSSYVFHPMASDEIPGGHSESLGGKEHLNLNNSQNTSQIRQASDHEGRSASQTAKLDSMSSTSKESVRSIRSILKKGNSVDVGADTIGFKDDEGSRVGGSHPFKSLAVPVNQARYDGKDKNHSDDLQTHNRQNERASVLSMSSKTSPIKFNEKVQTIPVPNENQENQESLSNGDMYNIAMKAAMNKVYGNREEKAFDRNDEQNNTGESGTIGVPQTGKKFLKNEKKIENFSHQGLGPRYDYQNHHRDFVGLSLRNNNNTKKKQKQVDVENKKKQVDAENKKKQVDAENKKKQAEAQQEAEHKEAVKKASQEVNQEDTTGESRNEKKESKKNKKQGKRFNLGGLFHNKKKSASENEQPSNEDGVNKDEYAYVVRLPMSVTYGDEADNQGTNIETVKNKYEDSLNAEKPTIGSENVKDKSVVGQTNEDVEPKETVTSSQTTKPDMQKDSFYEVPSHAFLQEDKLPNIGSESSIRGIDNADDAVTAPLKKQSSDEPSASATSNLENPPQKLKDKTVRQTSNFGQTNSERPEENIEAANKKETDVSKNYSADKETAESKPNSYSVFVPPNNKLGENVSSYSSHYSSSDKLTNQHINEYVQTHDNNAGQRDGATSVNADAFAKGNDESNKLGDGKDADGFVHVNGEDENAAKAGEAPPTGDEIPSDSKGKHKGPGNTKSKSNKKSEKFKHNFLKLFVNTYVEG